LKEVPMKRLRWAKVSFTGALALTVCLALPPVSAAEEARRRAHEVAGQEGGAADVDAEVGLGREVAARILGRYRLVGDATLARYVELVGSGLARYSGRGELTYHFAVLDTDGVNAYAAPGGYVFVTRGALSTMRDEAELAGVLAHEIGHITQGHIVKELHVRGWEGGASAGLARLLGGAGASAQEAFGQAVDGALEVLFEKGYKIEDELEADRAGMLLLATVGYDPTSVDRYLARATTSDANHPSLQERRSRLQELAAGLGLTSLHTTLEERFAKHVKTR
jgi:predicted Zn-dependent protease